MGIISGDKEHAIRSLRRKGDNVIKIKKPIS